MTPSLRRAVAFFFCARLWGPECHLRVRGSQIQVHTKKHLGGSPSCLVALTVLDSGRVNNPEADHLSHLTLRTRPPHCQIFSPVSESRELDQRCLRVYERRPLASHGSDFGAAQSSKADLLPSSLVGCKQVRFMVWMPSAKPGGRARAARRIAAAVVLGHDFHARVAVTYPSTSAVLSIT